MTTDFQDQDNQFEELGEGDGNRTTPPPTGGNRLFSIAIGIIGTIFVIALIILLATLFTRGPQQASQTSEQVKTIVAYNTKVAGTATADAVKALQAQATVDAAAKAPPPTATPPQAATPTGVLAIPTATRTPIPTVSPENATKTAFALTLGVGGAVGTSYPGQGTPQPTATALPSTGFADEVGLPGLLGMAAIMLVVIFLARRVRLVTH